MEMVDYYPLRYNHKEPEPDLEPVEEQEEQQPVVVDFVFNTYTERNGKTIALKISLQLPLHASQCPHREAAAQFSGYSRTHTTKEA